MNIIRVLLVDDHFVVRSGFCRLLENTADIKVIAEASSGEEAYTAYKTHQPDVVVMDLSMEGIGGLGAIRKIRRYDDKARILVFSVYENSTFLTRALNEGVRGYISKRSAAKVMIEAVRTVAQNKVFIGSEMQPFLVQYSCNSGDSVLNKLSSRELDVFKHLAEGKKVSEIAEIFNLSPKTVGHHYTHIKQKLDINTLSELTKIAIMEGILDVSEMKKEQD